MSIEELITFYKGKLEIKERLIVEYVEEKNSDEGFRSTKRETEYCVYKAEIDLLTRFIENLEYIKE